MAKLLGTPRLAGLASMAAEGRVGDPPAGDREMTEEKPRTIADPRLPLPGPKIAKGPYRPFTSDPGLHEGWWWLGFPLLVAAFVLGTYWYVRPWYMRYVLPEGYGILEISHFLIPLFGLFIATSLLLLPFVRQRPFVFTVGRCSAP